MDAATTILFLPAPIAGAFLAWGFWRAESREPVVGRWKSTAIGLMAGTLLWPAAIGTIWAASVVLFRLAVETFWIFMALATWTPGRG